MGTRTAHLRLDVEFDAEPISGWVGTDLAEPRRFVGYTGLIAALQSIRGDDPTASLPPALEGDAER